MQSDENPITSQNYADIIIEYQGDKSLLNGFGNNPVTIINDVVALVNIPLQDVESSISTYAYARIPSIGGLVSDNSLEASGILKIRNIPNFNLRGQGVLMAIIDTGIEYTNPIFLNADKTTRIISIWDQTIESSTPQEGIKYGTIYSREQINKALQSENPYQIVPSRDENGHGTMVAGIAGGSESPENNFSGVAPDVELVVVKLKQVKNFLREYYFVPEKTFCSQETDFLFALEYVLSVAAKLQKPLAVCVSTNGSQGAHDGRSITGRYLSSVATRQGIGIIIAAGNEGNARRHYYGTVDPATGYDIVELNVGADEIGFPMEIWGESPSILTIDILSPSGEYIPRITASRNENRQISFIFEDTIIDVTYTLVETESGDQLILLRFKKPAPGIWKFHVYERGNLKVGFHIWLPMEGFISDNTFFIRPDPYTTILAVGNTQNPVTVTAYNSEDDSLSISASRGYTRLNLVKPNIAAPGVNVTGPTLDKSFTTYTGTSVAAAHTTGVAAMLLEWGVVKGNLVGMSSVEINKLLMRGARRSADLQYPNRDWGYGILDVFNVFDSLRGGSV
jgi:Subtilase family.